MNHMAAFGISPNAGAFVLTIPALCCKNIFGSKSGVCFEISCMASNINFPKPQQKHEIRQFSKM